MRLNGVIWVGGLVGGVGDIGWIVFELMGVG